ncbi:Crp/Fnr family transcriptional regulator [Jiella marina]|uniref:Crp/Fnr family transcriptional regulator n=1 Tax=Jiella sp. LLJ827 TaxID=2917712 RepID=UPI002100C726|nr:Crp/Fnr family transcriptional regulator [Jiella sp. LLJ827]MCQ0989070.1 Crp/Fnr family transcriptional regulator [Jiella sp. LLJ827]
MGPTLPQEARHGAQLADADERILIELARRTQRAEAGRDIVAEGTEPHSIILILDGWACRYKVLPDGKRLNTSIFLPGDLCEPFGVLPRFMDHALATLTPVVFARIPLSAIRRAAREHPRIEEALWWDLLAMTAIEREHMISLGRRLATERLGHVFCEFHLRLAMAGRVDGLSYDMPVTQSALSDLFGLSVVQTNRSLAELRQRGLISLRKRRLTILDLEGLREFSSFDGTYLQTAEPVVT